MSVVGCGSEGPDGPVRHVRSKAATLPADAGSDGAREEPRAGYPTNYHLGAPCEDDVDCAPRHQCAFSRYPDGTPSSGGECACAAELSACPDDCWDLTRDPFHCGACDRQCPEGALCQGGRCLDAPADGATAPAQQAPAEDGDTGSFSAALSVAEPGSGTAADGAPVSAASASSATVTTFLISGGNPSGSSGWSWRADEPAVDESTPSGGATAGFNTPNPPSASWGTTPSSWAQYPFAVPILGGFTPLGDPALTHSNYTGLNYYAAILNNTSLNINCLGMGGATGFNWNGGGWDYRVQCFNNVYADGTSIHYDDGFHNLWAAAGGANRMYLFQGCTGRPGFGPGCAVTAQTTLQPPNGYPLIASHPNVDVNPCTHSGLVAYRAAQSRDPGATHAIVLEVHDKQTAALTGQYIVDTFTFQPNDGCTFDNPISVCPGCRAAGASGCIRSNQQVKITTKQSGGTCYAYIGYDRSCSAGGHNLLKSKLVIAEILSDVYTPVRSYTSTACGTNGNNEFHTTVSASKWTNDVGFFFYRQVGTGSSMYDPCNTYVKGLVDGALGLTSMTNTIAFVSSFPSVEDNITNGMGDFAEAARHGTLDGLLTAWGQAIRTTDTAGIQCPPGSGIYYTVGIEGALVVP